MKKYIFSIISDALFIALCAFFITFVFARFYIKSLATALSLSLAIGSVSGVSAFFAEFSSRKKIILHNADSATVKSLAMHLTLLKKSEVIKLLEYALGGERKSGNRIKKGERDYFFIFSMSPVTPDGVARIIKADGESQKTLLCCQCDEKGKNLAAAFNIKIIEIGEIYALLKAKNLLPEKYIGSDIKSRKAFNEIKTRFNRKLCPSLFFSGCALLFCSFFTFYPIYYISFGSALLVCAAVCVFIRQSN